MAKDVLNLDQLEGHSINQKVSRIIPELISLLHFVQDSDDIEEASDVSKDFLYKLESLLSEY